MKLKLIRILSFLSLFSLSGISLAGPWYTGPLLAPAGHTIPRGHTNLEIYGFKTDIQGIYDNFGHVMHTLSNKNVVVNTLFSHGLTDKVDMQFSLPYAYNMIGGVRAHRLSDVNAQLGYQLLEQKSFWHPNLRIALQETIPTGRYDLLNPANNGADVTGLGSYQTTLNFNFQYLKQLSEIHYLRTRLSMAYTYASNVHVNGYSAYGGNAYTNGEVNLGNMGSIDLATELSLTQNWVAVMELFSSNRAATKFTGNPGFDVESVLFNIGPDVSNIGQGVSRQTTLAPALEYNFTANVGVIAGVWFTVLGHQTAKFTSTVVALNAYW